MIMPVINYVVSCLGSKLVLIHHRCESNSRKIILVSYVKVIPVEDFPLWLSFDVARWIRFISFKKVLCHFLFHSCMCFQIHLWLASSWCRAHQHPIIRPVLMRRADSRRTIWNKYLGHLQVGGPLWDPGKSWSTQVESVVKQAPNQLRCFWSTKTSHATLPAKVYQYAFPSTHFWFLFPAS